MSSGVGRSYNSRPCLQAAPCELDPAFYLGCDVGVFVHGADQIYFVYTLLCVIRLVTAASIAIGVFQVTCPGVRNSIVSVFVSDTTVRPAASKTVTRAGINCHKGLARAGIIISGLPAISTRYRCHLHTEFPIPLFAFYTGGSFGPAYFILLEVNRVDKYTAIRTKRVYEAQLKIQFWRAVVTKHTLVHPCWVPCVTPNHSEHSPSYMGVRACVLSWNLRITTIIASATPKRASTSHSSSRSTKL